MHLHDVSAKNAHSRGITYPALKSCSISPLSSPTLIVTSTGSSSLPRHPSKTLAINTLLNLPVSSYIVRVCFDPPATAASTSRRRVSTTENDGPGLREWATSRPLRRESGKRMVHDNTRSRSRGSNNGKRSGRKVAEIVGNCSCR